MPRLLQLCKVTLPTTPGTAMSRGRIVHNAMTDMSRCESFVDVTPIIIMRLSVDSGCKMTGCRATVRNCSFSWISSTRLAYASSTSPEVSAFRFS